MAADLCIVRLNRKIIRDSSKSVGHIEEGTDIEGYSEFFATDYFDLLEVKKKELTNPFTAIMGIWPDEGLDVNDVAIQSYSLYCSSGMLSAEEGGR